MAFVKHEQVVVVEEEDYSDNGSDPGYDSDMDPCYSILDETRGKFSNLFIKKKSKFSIGNDFDMGVEIDPEEAKINVGEIDERSFKLVQEIIEAGKLEKLKVEQCKVYLRKNGLRLTGNKETLIQRIREHQEILNGEGEKKYPKSSFVLNCKGDACMGDIVMFEQNVYEMYNIASRSASGPPCGTRIVAGRIVKESYGAAKQQHTFTIEVLWSRGEKPLPPLHPLLIKGRNLYRLKTLRQRWEDEEERRKVLMEKHSRGSLARCARETRIQEKERRKMIRENRALTKEETNSNQSQLKSTSKTNQGIQTQQSGPSVNLGKAALEPRWSKPTTEARISGMSVDAFKMGGQPQKLATQPHSGSSILAVKVGSGAQQLAIQHQHSDLLVDSFKPINQPTQQPSFSVETRKLVFQPELQNERGIGNYNQVPSNLVDHTGIQEVQHHHPFNEYPNTTWKHGVSERYHPRQPLTSMNLHHPGSLLNRQVHQQQKLCKFYAQGRCTYGDNCKFLHDLKGIYGQEGKRGVLTARAG